MLSEGGSVRIQVVSHQRPLGHSRLSGLCPEHHGETEESLKRSVTRPGAVQRMTWQSQGLCGKGHPPREAGLQALTSPPPAVPGPQLLLSAVPGLGEGNTARSPTTTRDLQVTSASVSLSINGSLVSGGGGATSWPGPETLVCCSDQAKGHGDGAAEPPLPGEMSPGVRS